MQLPKENKFDPKTIEQTLKKENEFINHLFSFLALPNRPDGNNEDTNEENSESIPKKSFKFSDKTRAKSLSELQQRLEAISGKKNLTYKEKLAKKSLKNRMKKKTKRDERNASQKLLRAQKLTQNIHNTNDNNDDDSKTEVIKTSKPVFNVDSKMVFSKFDFSNVGSKKKMKKQEKDPKKLLKNLEKQQEQLTELVESGDVEKAVEIKEKAAWKNALAKAEGQKVKDDPILLKKTVQRQEQKKRSSKKKWEAREKGVAKAKEDRQKKRTDNIQKRKKDKKVHKLKKAAKKGKIIPGF